MEVQNKFPHYTPSFFGGVKADPSLREPPLKCDGKADFYDFPKEGSHEDYYEQANKFYHTLSEEDQQHLCFNIITSWEKIPEDMVTRLLDHFSKVDKDLGNRLGECWKKCKEGARKKMDAEILIDQLNKALKPQPQSV